MTAARTRLDTLLVARGLAESREKARALILAGKVRVAGHAAAKAGSMVPEHAAIEVAAPEHPWVSRGGIKLAHALDGFGIEARDRLAIDLGASTGGFTDVLLQRGARQVIALDVGHGQLHWKLRTDPRVIVIEGVNARTLNRSSLPDLGDGADVVTIDVSFISLAYILPVVPELLAPSADVVALVKPQFEAGREAVGKGGIVRSEAARTKAVEKVRAFLEETGWKVVGLIDSPIRGGSGNPEYLLGARLDQPR